jgi:hypothetical protein
MPIFLQLRKTMQAEVFYLYHLGEQRGPYTARQVNHLHRCEFIDDDTLYWREGMEQWAPITQIVLRRKKRRRLLGWTVTIAILIGLGVLGSFFGPVTLNAWRELTSGGFSEEDAYWRSRLMVRQALGNSVSVNFDPIEKAKVLLQPPSGASVVLTGSVRDSNGTHRGAWRVRMIHVADQQQWFPAPPENKKANQ